LPQGDRVDWDRLVTDWLNGMRSPNTRRAYQKDIAPFLQDDELHLGKLISDRYLAYEILSRYRGTLLQQGLASATINRRLSAIKSLIAYCFRCGHSEFTLEAVKLEMNRNYRDTSGIDAISFK
jgi:integrase/recombinase XerC